MKTSYISHVLLLELKCVSFARSMYGNLEQNKLENFTNLSMNSDTFCSSNYIVCRAITD